jgi:hypothetical protein
MGNSLSPPWAGFQPRPSRLPPGTACPFPPPRAAQLARWPSRRPAAQLGKPPSPALGPFGGPAFQPSGSPPLPSRVVRAAVKPPLLPPRGTHPSAVSLLQTSLSLSLPRARLSLSLDAARPRPRVVSPSILSPPPFLPFSGHGAVQPAAAPSLSRAARPRPRMPRRAARPRPRPGAAPSPAVARPQLPLPWLCSGVADHGACARPGPSLRAAALGPARPRRPSLPRWPPPSLGHGARPAQRSGPGAARPWRSPVPAPSAPPRRSAPSRRAPLPRRASPAQPWLARPSSRASAAARPCCSRGPARPRRGASAAWRGRPPAQPRFLRSAFGPGAAPLPARGVQRVHGSAPTCARLVRGTSARTCARTCSRVARGALARLAMSSA